MQSTTIFPTQVWQVRIAGDLGVARAAAGQRGITLFATREHQTRFTREGETTTHASVRATKAELTDWFANSPWGDNGTLAPGGLGWFQRVTEDGGIEAVCPVRIVQPVMPGQMTVDECIARAEADA